ncbi:hypothetical protein NECAME_05613 [Necator americanus]|uniref:Uncharacterized protein n=1 Tax=Necator americanus TaxID=51031 RepID=W2SFR3_NECAM|nr:hypothetical protein NECAME_05613 [Necator americanus]ETN68425.1 hypothetical protein NECAME_05613 [Necator americanus]
MEFSDCKNSNKKQFANNDKVDVLFRSIKLDLRRYGLEKGDITAPCVAASGAQMIPISCHETLLATRRCADERSNS